MLPLCYISVEHCECTTVIDYIFPRSLSVVLLGATLKSYVFSSSNIRKQVFQKVKRVQEAQVLTQLLLAPSGTQCITLQCISWWLLGPHPGDKQEPILARIGSVCNTSDREARVQIVAVIKLP